MAQRKAHRSWRVSVTVFVAVFAATTAVVGWCTCGTARSVPMTWTAPTPSVWR